MCPFMRQINVFDDMIRWQQTQFIAINIWYKCRNLELRLSSNWAQENSVADRSEIINYLIVIM